MDSTDSSGQLSPAAGAFAEFLELLQDDENADFEGFCAARPELEERLRSLHERWRAMNDALSALGDAPGPATADDSTRGLVDRLRRGDRHERRGEIARGGMGAVWKVWDGDIRRHLAMKVLLEEPGRPVDGRSLSRFLEEAQITGQLEHPGIVPVHEMGLDAEGRVYFTMRLVRGKDLREIIDMVHAGREGWTRTRALGVIERVCEAMGFAHSKGVLHRDLKPANVMVGAFGETYVMDWGLARVIDRGRVDLPAVEGAAEVSTDLRTVRSETERTPQSPLLTQDGDVVGTPVYMSPEQAHGWVDRLGPHTDVYSIGAMLYHLLTGCRPYKQPGEESSSMEVLRAVKTRPPRPVHELAPHVPAELEAICERAMARDQRQRYGTTMELAEELRAFQEMRVVQAYRTGAVAELRKWVQRNRKLAAAVLAGSVAVVAGLVVSLALFVQSRANEQRADENAGRLARELRTNTIQQGRLLGRTGDFGSAEGLLWRAFLTDLEDPEPLWALRELYARNPTLTTVQAHDLPPGTGIVRTLAVAPDGSFLVTCADDRAIRVWDALTLRPITTLDGHEEWVWGVAVHPDGRHVASAGTCGKVLLWDLSSERIVRVLLDEDSTFPTQVAFHPAGDRLAVGFRDGSIHVVDLESGEQTALLDPVGGGVATLAYDARGQHLAAASHRAGAYVLRGEELVAHLEVDQLSCLAVAFSPDGGTLATGTGDQRVRLYPVGAWEDEEVLEPSVGNVRGVGFDPGGRLLAVSGWYGVQLIDLDTRATVNEFRTNQNTRGTAFLPGERLVTAIEPGDLRMWGLSSLDATQVIDGYGENAFSAFTHDGRRLVIGDQYGRLAWWDALTGERLGDWQHMEEGVRGVRLGPDGTLVVGGNGVVRVLDPSDGSVRHTFEGLRSVTSAGFDVTPGGVLWMAADAGRFERRDLASGALLGTSGDEGLGTAISLRASQAPGGGCVSVSRRIEVRSWSADGELLGGRTLGNEPWSGGFSSDGARIAIGTWKRVVEVWDTALENRLAILHGHDGIVWSVDWHPSDPHLVASCAGDGTVRLWDARTGRNLRVIEAGVREPIHLRFSPDGRSLLVAGVRGEVVLHDLEYHDRHVAGNLAYQLERLRGEDGLVPAHDLEAWTEAVLARTWPRFQAMGGR